MFIITKIKPFGEHALLQLLTKAQSLTFLLFILFLLKPENGQGQSQHYDVYHQHILKAETFYFIENNVDSALYYYQKCFESYDFVFARDAVNAIQIAYKEKQPLDYFLKTAIETGVTPSILSSISALSDFAKDSLQKLGVMQNYELYRSRYLARINVACLNRIYRLGIFEQIHKATKHETKALFKMALVFGLPGEKNCGIEELGIDKELGNGAEDFLSLRDSMSEKYGASIRYYTLHANTLNPGIPIVIMLHDKCTYKYFEKDLREAYLSGFIHPREIGLIYDNAFLGKE